MSRIAIWNLGLSLLTAVLLVLSFPRFDLFYLAPFALAPLLIAAAREPSARRRFLNGIVAGVVYWFAVCYWIQFVLANHGGMSEWGAWGAFLLLCLGKSIHMGVFTWLAGYLMDRPWAVPAVAALWVGIERTHGPLGFAWLCLGNAGVDMGVPMRLAPYVGVYGLSFVFVLMSGGLAMVACRRPRLHLAWLAVLPFLYLLPALPEPAAGEEQAISVQPNIAMEEVWTGDKVVETRQQLGLLSMEEAFRPGEPAPELLLWPEVPAPFYYEIDRNLREELNNLARLTRTYFLLGTVAYNADGAPLNSVQFISPQGAPVARYDKIFLVPFGEFIPPGFSWINRITSEASDFAPGDKIVVQQLDGHSVGAFICYESVFPHLVRQFAADGAELFVNLSNDGYFGTTAAREQHLFIARMRAAENRRWILRSTNNGITASIDPAGRVVRTAEEFTRTAIRLPFSYVSETTVYSRHGDWFAWMCLLAGLGAVAAAWVPRYRR